VPRRLLRRGGRDLLVSAIVVFGLAIALGMAHR